MAWCKKCQIAGIKLLLKKNYHIPIYKTDLHSEVDATLRFGENWTVIKDKYVKHKMEREDD